MTDNACGSCTACCRVYSISEIGKPAGQWCEHCAVGKGCKVYETRPWKCVEFECLWLQSQHGGFGPPMPDEMRPDRCKVVFSPLDDTFIALCMPGSPDAWRKGAGRKVVDWLVGNGYRVLAGLPGAPTKTFIDRFCEREVHVGEPDETGKIRLTPTGGRYANAMTDDIVERVREMGLQQVWVDSRGCPHCGAKDGPAWIGDSVWHYCAKHRVKWLAGWDLTHVVDKVEQERRYKELGLGGFEHIRRDEVEALAVQVEKAAADNRLADLMRQLEMKDH